jgi:hypothetical protein
LAWVCNAVTSELSLTSSESTFRNADRQAASLKSSRVWSTEACWVVASRLALRLSAVASCRARCDSDCFADHIAARTPARVVSIVTSRMLTARTVFNLDAETCSRCLISSCASLSGFSMPATPRSQ